MISNSFENTGTNYDISPGKNTVSGFVTIDSREPFDMMPLQSTDRMIGLSNYQLNVYNESIFKRRFTLM